MVTAEIGHHKWQRRHEPAAFLEQVLAFVDGFPGQFELGVLQITQPAVDKFGGTAGCARGKVALLEQDCFQPGAGGLAQDSHTGDAPSNNN